MKVKRINNYDYKALNVIPEILELLRKNKFTVKETESFLSRESFNLVMEYIFYFNRNRGDNEDSKIVPAGRQVVAVK